MHKQGIGQAYCKYPLKRIPNKFILHFSEFYIDFKDLEAI
jgi:hypothetical protein